MMQIWGGRTSASSDCFCYRCGNAYLTWQALCRKYKALLEVPRVCFYFFFFPTSGRIALQISKLVSKGCQGLLFPEWTPRASSLGHVLWEKSNVFLLCLVTGSC